MIGAIGGGGGGAPMMPALENQGGPDLGGADRDPAQAVENRLQDPRKRRQGQQDNPLAQLNIKPMEGAGMVGGLGGGGIMG